MHQSSILSLLFVLFSGVCIPYASSFSISATESTSNPFALSTLKGSSTLSFPDVDGALANLFGSEHAREAFFSHHFKETPVHILRKEAKFPSPLQKVCMHDFYKACEFINLRKRGSMDLLDKSTTSFQDLGDYIQAGGSAVVSVVEKETGKIYELKQRLEQCFGQELSFNIYHSGPNGVALTPHYDAYDVFVLQLEGEKTWKIMITEEDSVTLTLVPGDLLYIPTPVVHSAKTSDGFDVSTHVTIGLDPKLKK